MINYMKKVSKIILFSAIGFALIGLVASILYGYFGSITTWTPYWIITSRSEFKDGLDNILLGNEHMYFQSPLLIELGTPAWSAKDSVYGLNALSDEAKNGNKVTYKIYSEEEIKEDKTREQVSIFTLRSKEETKKPYILLLAGGGFTSVCTTTESLPVAAKFNEYGYTTICMTYRTSKEFGQYDSLQNIVEDINRTILFINEHNEDFNCLKDEFYIGGFSAGAMCACFMYSDKAIVSGINKPRANILMYGYDKEIVLDKNIYNIPTFMRLCKNDQFFDKEDYLNIENAFNENGIAHDLKIVDAPHGFGLGTKFKDTSTWTEECIDVIKNI